MIEPTDFQTGRAEFAALLDEITARGWIAAGTPGLPFYGSYTVTTPFGTFTGHGFGRAHSLQIACMAALAAEKAPRMISTIDARTKAAAKSMYLGSSLCFGPWEALPEARRTAWEKTAAHLTAETWDRRSAVQLVHERARRARLQRLAAA